MSESRFFGKPAVFGITSGKPKLLRGDWLSAEWLREKFSARPKIGETKIVQKSGGDELVRYLLEVLPTDARYPEAWRQEFERAGFYAAIVTEKMAKLCEDIRGSKIDHEAQDQVVYGVGRLSDEDIGKIQKELEKIA